MVTVTFNQNHHGSVYTEIGGYKIRFLFILEL